MSNEERVDRPSPDERADNLRIYGGCLVGVRSLAVDIEAQVMDGLPGFDLVGLPERAVRESLARVRAAVASAGIELPARRYCVNLAPAELPKAGAALDVAIAVAVLHAADLITAVGPRRVLMLGELSLAGQLRPVRGVMAHLRMAAATEMGHLIVPACHREEVSLALQFVPTLKVSCASDLKEAVAAIAGRAMARQLPATDPVLGEEKYSLDLGDVSGQGAAKRALAIAAAGRHHILFVGPPGAGKSMLARRLPTIMPPPTPKEAIEIATIASVERTEMSGVSLSRPFRAPHHDASVQALIGGGRPLRPGEVTLAHLGVLFLDELPEFRRNAIEAFRTTMEQGSCAIARAHQKVTMPARALVVAAMNPCPCGYATDPERRCRCSYVAAQRYRARVSGPLLDRFDLQVAVPRTSSRDLRGASVNTATRTTSAEVRRQVVAAHAILEAQNVPAKNPLATLVKLAESAALDLLDQMTRRLGLSARGYVKVLNVARTVAALGQSEVVRAADIAEAAQYRLQPSSEVPGQSTALLG